MPQNAIEIINPSTLPACRWRGAIEDGRCECRSPKLLGDSAPLMVCTGEAFGLRACKYADHEPEEEPAAPAKSKHPPVDPWRPYTSGPTVRGLAVNWWGCPADALCHHLRGAPVFLVCGGPSLNDTDLSLLDQPGLITATVNQCAATHLRPTFSFLADPCRKFHSKIWRDPGIVKFTRRDLSRDRVTVEWGQTPGDNTWRVTREGERVRDLPNVWFYEHDYGFEPRSFLTRRRVSWGADYRSGPKGKLRGTRNVMLVALRLLYWLGARTVFLVGCDFQMQAGKSYAFDETKDGSAAGTNNNSYAILNGWFAQLRPHFEQRDFHVVNCTPGSRLDAFEHCDYTAAVAAVAAGVPPAETVRGMYRL